MDAGGRHSCTAGDLNTRLRRAAGACFEKREPDLLLNRVYAAVAAGRASLADLAASPPGDLGGKLRRRHPHWAPVAGAAFVLADNAVSSILLLGERVFFWGSGLSQDVPLIVWPEIDPCQLFRRRVPLPGSRCQCKPR